ncbi:hypothetical protein IFR05_000343 [Cadophora sp. M221]|nr:hypothetical protein IFR05_000343 [Cadophora sp. M221]
MTLCLRDNQKTDRALADPESPAKNDHMAVSEVGSCMSSVSGGSLLSSPGSPTPISMGLDLFNQQLTVDPRKRIANTSTSTPTASSNSQHVPCKFEDLLNTVVSLNEARKQGRSTATARIETALIAINSHAKAVDVLIQQQPDITAVVWGAFRFLLGIAAKEIEGSERIHEALASIVENLERWNKYIDLFDEFEGVRKAAARLFSQIINFLVRARIYYQKSRAGETEFIRYFSSGMKLKNLSARHIKIAFSPWSEKYKSIMNLINQESSSLEREAELAFQIRCLRDQKVKQQHLELQRLEISKQEKFRDGQIIPEDNEPRLNTADVAAGVQHLQDATNHLEYRTAMKWLSRNQTSNPISSPEEGTCMWIQQSETWRNWQVDEYSKPLCIFGAPGTGKSTAAQHLFRTSTTKITISHFFRSVVDKDLAKPTPFAAAVLYDLLQNDIVMSAEEYTATVKQVATLSLSRKRVNDVPFHDLWRIVEAVVKTLPEVMLIVDGLDECDELTRTELGTAIAGLSSLKNTRMIVSCRNHRQIDTIFRDAFRIELTPASVTNDIRLYVEAEVRRHSKKLEPLKLELLETVMKSAKGMFLWVVLLVEELKQAETLEIQRQCLATVPRDLFSFYTMILRKTGSNLHSESLRREIFLILVGLRQALRCQEISFILSLKYEKMPVVDNFHALIESEEALSRVCGDLVQISDGRVHLSHETVKDYLLCHPDRSIQVTTDETEAYLAFKCLVALSQEEYRSLNKISILIRQNVGAAAAEDEDKYFYQYAATHWYIHLVVVKDPELRLVQLVAAFLQGNEFVSWSEFVYRLSGSQGMALEVESKLKIWKANLKDEMKNLLPLGKYFGGPYRAAAEGFNQNAGDKTLPFLTLYQLGEYLNLATRIQEAFQVKRTVAEGLVKLLGERNPLALKAESAFALEYLGQRLFPEAESTFARLAQIQREVIGEDRPDCFQSLQRQGMAELWMTKFVEADSNLTESLQGLLSTTGPQSFLYLMSQLTLGQVLEYRGEVRRANLDYQHVWIYRKSTLGPDNPMAVWARCAMVSGYRKLRLYKEAEEAVLEVIDARTRTLGSRTASTVDAIIQRLVLYLDAERFSEALEIAEFILDGDLVDEWFERLCQVEHVRALLELFTENTAVAIDILEDLVAESLKRNEKGRVRSMLWVRLDLATLLRRQGRDDDALMLFDEIVTRVSSESNTSLSNSTWEITQSPHDLQIAEEALRLVREIKTFEAKVLLKKNELKWVRQEDFWILDGNPPADTAWMKRP